MSLARVVQITDLHILSDKDASLRGMKPWYSLAKVIEDIRGLNPQPQLVVASGDLTDEGNPKAYQNLRQLLLRLSCPVYLMAGNHDETEIMRTELVGDNIFYQHQVDCQDWRLLFVNSKVEGKSHGHVGKGEFAWLRQQLQHNSQKTALIAMHHTPLRLCASPTCQLENADELIAGLSEFNNVKGIIAGHTHNDVEEMRGDIRIMTTPSTMVQVTHNQNQSFSNRDEFWNFHEADISRHGYRILDLYSGADFDSEIRWVSDGRTNQGFSAPL